MEFWNPSDEEWNQIFKRDDLESVQKLFHLMELSEIMVQRNKKPNQYQQEPNHNQTSNPSKQNRWF